MSAAVEEGVVVPTLAEIAAMSAALAAAIAALPTEERVEAISAAQAALHDVSPMLKGWEDMGLVLEVHRNVAQRYADRDVDPLPVWYDHAERPRIHVSAVQAWINRQALFYRTFHALKEAGQLPNQRRERARAEGGPKKRHRPTKIGARAAKKKAKKP